MTIFLYKKKARSTASSVLALIIPYIAKVILFSIYLQSSQPGYAQSGPVQTLKSANQAYIESDYTKALNLYRKYLRKRPKDADAWTLAAACYYHLAQPNRALKILKKFQSETKFVSQNQLYQGLAFDATNRTKLARRYLKLAAKHSDPFAALAVFELFSIEHEELNRKRALFWLRQYKERFANQSYSEIVEIYIQKIQDGLAFEVKESQRTAYRRNYYKFSPSSLVPFEHWWGFQFGFDYQLNTEVIPPGTPTDPLTKATDEIFGPKLKMTFGLGPYTTGDTNLWFGYNYLQFWASDSSRVARYFKDPIDLKQLPFTTDLLERQHQGIFRIFSPITKQLDFQLHTEVSYENVGSSLSFSSIRQEFKRSFKLSSSSLVIPSIIWNLPSNNLLEFYLYLEKKLDHELIDLSYKTYEIFDFDKFFTSFALSYNHVFVDYRVNLWADGFYFKYLANDPWRDRTRMGIALTADKKWKNFKFAARSLIFQDSYDRSIDTSSGCNTRQTEISDEIISCTRNDQGYLLQGGVSYTFSNKDIVFLTGNFHNRKSPKQIVYDQEKMGFMFGYAIGFPDRKRSTMFLNAYQRTSETYEGLLP